MRSELAEFVRGALAAGVGRPRIAEALRGAGWSEAEVRAALESFADAGLPLPVPRPTRSPTARAVFLYLLAFGALYVCALHVGAMAFAFIDRAFPDPLAHTYGSDPFIDAVRWNAAALVVALPLFLLSFRAIENAVEADPAKRRSWPRAWLTHLTLLGAAVIIAGTLVVLVYTVLGGEYGSRFLLKVATVGAIAGGIFAHFLSDLRREEP